jgi:hypothetical protein
MLAFSVKKAYCFRSFKGRGLFRLGSKLREITHEERLRIARLISDRVVKKYGSDILADYVCGSTSKRLDRPYSDLTFATL